jgi:hypothetical protein
MPDIPVDPASITAEWLSEVLSADVHGCRLEQIAIGVGLLGRLFRVHLHGGPGVPKSIVVKLPTLDKQARAALCQDLEFYLREVRFYREIGLANPLPPARPYFADFDESTHDFVLVLEDLARLRIADQTLGCSADDAGTVVDGIAAHHATWWDSPRLHSLSWLKTYSEPPYGRTVVDNIVAAWPTFLDRMGHHLAPEVRRYGERLPTLIPWLLAEIARPPNTFLHGDLRLDQLFFAVTADDPPVTALDWQVTAKGRGAYDLAYFLTQSLSADVRRRCEGEMIERYAERLSEYGIVYPRGQLLADYRNTVAICFCYPLLAAGRVDIANDRQSELLQTMVNGSVLAMEDHDVLSLRPD